MNRLVIVIFIMIIIVIIKYIEPIINKVKLKNKNEYGSARFSTVKEIKDNFKEESIASINEVGFPILFNKKLNKVWFDRETPHWIYLGSTGSGKSVTQVIPYCSFLSSTLKHLTSSIIYFSFRISYKCTSLIFSRR